VTEGHFHLRVVSPFVPSRPLTTLVMVFMAVLEPDMRSMLKLVHLPVVSKFQEMVHSPPSLKLCPGPGAVGTTPAAWAPATKSSDRVRPEIMLKAICARWGETRKEKIQERK